YTQHDCVGQYNQGGFILFFQRGKSRHEVRLRGGRRIVPNRHDVTGASAVHEVVTETVIKKIRQMGDLRNERVPRTCYLNRDYLRPSEQVFVLQQRTHLSNLRSALDSMLLRVA